MKTKQELIDDFIESYGMLLRTDISELCAQIAEVQARSLSFTFCPRCGREMNPKYYDASAKPEKDLTELIEIAAGCLPEGFSIFIEVENGAAGVVIRNSDLNKSDIDIEVGETITEKFKEALTFIETRNLQ